MADITHLLAAVERGESGAAEQLWPLVYDELRRLAGARMAHEKLGHTLDATALVHEAYVRLAADDNVFANRRHFFAAASQAMRRILVENARAKGRRKRDGGRREHPDLDTVAAGETAEDLLELHDALELFAAHDAVKARLVELRFFAGLTLEQAAECLNISPSSADRAWRYARAWLYAAMSDSETQKK